MNQDRREQLLNEPYVQEILMRLQAAERDKRELEERLAIVNALAWDHYTVYDVDIETGNFGQRRWGPTGPPTGHGKTEKNIPMKRLYAVI